MAYVSKIRFQPCLSFSGDLWVCGLSPPPFLEPRLRSCRRLSFKSGSAWEASTLYPDGTGDVWTRLSGIQRARTRRWDHPLHYAPTSITPQIGFTPSGPWACSSAGCMGAPPQVYVPPSWVVRIDVVAQHPIGRGATRTFARFARIFGHRADPADVTGQMPLIWLCAACASGLSR